MRRRGVGSQPVQQGAVDRKLQHPVYVGLREGEAVLGGEPAVGVGLVRAEREVDSVISVDLPQSRAKAIKNSAIRVP